MITDHAQEHPRHPGARRRPHGRAIARRRRAYAPGRERRLALAQVRAPASWPLFRRRKSQTSRGLQTRQNSASAHERRQAADDVHELRADVVAPRELDDGEHAAADEHRRPDADAGRCHPLIVTTSQAGTISDTNGSCRPAIALSCIAGRPVTAASVRIGVPMAPNATGAVLAMSDEAGRVERREPESHQQRRADGDRRAEPGRAFDERAEGERDEQRLDAAIGRQAARPTP